MGAEPRPFALAEPGPAARVPALRDELAALWTATPGELPSLGPRVGWRRRFSNARAAAHLIDELAAEVVHVPDAPAARAAWRESVRERLQTFGGERLGWPAGYRHLLFGDAFFAASVAFARETRAFDPGLPLDDLWQATRNVWIGNSLQMLLDRPVQLGPGLFAYSLLYPLTDNLLDDPRLSRRAKQGFNERFGRRLAGRSVPASSAREADVFRLVARIEDEFPRHDFPGVHQSLLAIHHGQALSLRQQGEPALTDADLLAISCEKGGTSVLADLYLVAGRPARAEERFAFGYGVFLQLLDDLQDAQRDRDAGHQTLFTSAASRGPLDAPAARLACFIDRVLDEHLAGGEKADRKDLVRRNCQGLLAGAVADQPSLFTRAFRRSLSRQCAISLPAMRRLRGRARRRFRDASHAHERRTGLGLLDALLAQDV